MQLDLLYITIFKLEQLAVSSRLHVMYSLHLDAYICPETRAGRSHLEKGCVESCW